MGEDVILFTHKYSDYDCTLCRLLLRNMPFQRFLQGPGDAPINSQPHLMINQLAVAPETPEGTTFSNE
jgi:hypothetical protein